MTECESRTELIDPLQERRLAELHGTSFYFLTTHARYIFYHVFDSYLTQANVLRNMLFRENKICFSKEWYFVKAKLCMFKYKCYLSELPSHKIWLKQILQRCLCIKLFQDYYSSYCIHFYCSLYYTSNYSKISWYIKSSS